MHDWTPCINLANHTVLSTQFIYIQCRHLIPALYEWAACTWCTTARLNVANFLGMDAWMTFTTERSFNFYILYILAYLAYFCGLWSRVFVQLCTSRRLINWCRYQIFEARKGDKPFAKPRSHAIECECMTSPIYQYSDPESRRGPTRWGHAMGQSSVFVCSLSNDMHEWKCIVVGAATLWPLLYPR